MTSDRLNSAPEPAAAEMARASLTTPAGLQANAMLTRRRLGLLAAVLLLWGAFLSGAGYVLGAGGWTLLDIVLFVLVAIATPWAFLCFCNAAAGLVLLHGARKPLSAVAACLPPLESV